MWTKVKSKFSKNKDTSPPFQKRSIHKVKRHFRKRMEKEETAAKEVGITERKVIKIARKDKEGLRKWKCDKFGKGCEVEKEVSGEKMDGEGKEEMSGKTKMALLKTEQRELNVANA